MISNQIYVKVYHILLSLKTLEPSDLVAQSSSVTLVIQRSRVPIPLRSEWWFFALSVWKNSEELHLWTLNIPEWQYPTIVTFQYLKYCGMGGTSIWFQNIDTRTVRPRSSVVRALNSSHPIELKRPGTLPPFELARCRMKPNFTSRHASFTSRHACLRHISYWVVCWYRVEGLVLAGNSASNFRFQVAFQFFLVQWVIQRSWVRIPPGLLALAVW